MNARRFVLIDGATHNPTPSARRRFRWLLPIAWGRRDELLARNVCALIVAATPKPTYNGLRIALRPVTE